MHCLEIRTILIWHIQLRLLVQGYPSSCWQSESCEEIVETLVPMILLALVDVSHLLKAFLALPIEDVHLVEILILRFIVPDLPDRKLLQVDLVLKFIDRPPVQSHLLGQSRNAIRVPLDLHVESLVDLAFAGSIQSPEQHGLACEHAD